jgi:MraZ protein
MLRERCQLTIKLDDKGRIALPARLRRKLKEAGINAVVLTFFDGGIRGFSPAHFVDRIERPIAERDPFDPETQLLHHAVLAGSEDCPVDSQGRIRLPPRLREECELGTEVVLISILDWIEIWPPARWEARRRQALAQRAQKALGQNTSGTTG